MVLTQYLNDKTNYLLTSPFYFDDFEFGECENLLYKLFLAKTYESHFYLSFISLN